MPRAQPRQHHLQHAAQRLRAAALVEARLAARGQPADQRPAGDIALGDETHHSPAVQGDETGRASWRDSMCQDVYISVGAVSFNKILNLKPHSYDIIKSK